MILSFTEGEPTEYPALPPSVSAAAVAAVDAATVWQRLEQWISYRWGERQVEWIIQGPMQWEPNLRPMTMGDAEIWGDGWEPTVLKASPVGFELGGATYRITATVGDTEAPPANVLEAVGRLAEYFYQISRDPAAGTTQVTDGDYSVSRPAAWAARSIHYSGAGDLLRGYR